MKTTEIRQKFLDYFAAKGHQVVSSSSLVPANDPTLLFTNAGMVQFKEVFLGDESRAYNRAVTSQRCVRAGGKHNDLENVGYTARHHTFFEMLGNFSFGDYFKRDAIGFAWELLTEEFGLPADRLWITVFEEDDEAESIWLNDIGVPKQRVARIGAKDNFWQMGETGPCGPCSEIFYDHGPEVEGGPPGSVDEDGDRYVEIWNLVFMQFNRTAEGELEPLPKPSVDTGMGLERMAAVLQQVHSNYEIDLFEHLIKAASTVIGVKELENKSLRVIADHIRSTAFMIVDGVIPSNEGRGYVLRRIIRRAIRHGYQSGCKQSFMHLLVDPLIQEMGSAFPELEKSGDLVKRILKQENDKFNETLEQGLKILEQEIARLSGTTIPGDVVFKLYDTYGFPADLTADVAREQNLTIDTEQFKAAMEVQRDLAKSASKFAHSGQLKIEGLNRTPFVGYQDLEYSVEVAGLLSQDETVQNLDTGSEGMVILDKTPFYAESGGQVGDQGVIEFSNAQFQVSDTQYIGNKVIAHIGQVSNGTLGLQDQGRARVNPNLRFGSANNHSATHLLHAALKLTLGSHVDQKGSLVESDRLRFDFSHFEPITHEELSRIEGLVNEHIRRNHEVMIDIMDLEQAKAEGAAALFGEKYESEVRVVRMGEFSFELCGGTHVNRTGNIGFFKIISETGIAAGIRRIEALTGTTAEAYVARQLELIDQLAKNLKTNPANLGDRISSLLDSQKQQQKQIQQLQTRLATGETSSDVIKEIKGIKVVAIRQDDAEVKSMRMTVDQWKSKLQSGVVLVAGQSQGKVTLIAGVSKDLTNQFQAGSLIQNIAPLVGGKGGGRPDLAQGGGTNPEGIDQAIQFTYKWVEEHS